MVVDRLDTMAVDKFRRDRSDLIDAVICLLGVAVIIYAPRGASSTDHHRHQPVQAAEDHGRGPAACFGRTTTLSAYLEAQGYLQPGGITAGASSVLV